MKHFLFRRPPSVIRHPQRGFTLLELALVLAILSLLVGGVMVMLTQHIRTTTQASAKDKMDAIERAMESFRERYNRLPCPGDLTLAMNDPNFGYEASATGDCYSTGAIKANFSDGANTVAGAVPVKALNLPDEAMFDPWGGRFTYSVDNRMTAANAFVTYGPTSTAIGSITVNDGSGTPVAGNAIAVVISHGPNGHGAYQLSGARKSVGSDNAGELKNCHCKSDGSTDTFDNIFVTQAGSVSSSDPLNNFDDVLRYYTRTDFLSGAEQITDIP